MTETWRKAALWPGGGHSGEPDLLAQQQQALSIGLGIGAALGVAVTAATGGLAGPLVGAALLGTDAVTTTAASLGGGYLGATIGNMFDS